MICLRSLLLLMPPVVKACVPCDANTPLLFPVAGSMVAKLGPMFMLQGAAGWLCQLGIACAVAVCPGGMHLKTFHDAAASSCGFQSSIEWLVCRWVFFEY